MNARSVAAISVIAVLAACPVRAATNAAAPVAFTIPEAVLFALAHNPAVAAERLNPDIRRTFENQERAVFDPVLSARLAREKSEATQVSQGATGTQSVAAEQTTGRVAVDETLPTGTRLTVEGSTDVAREPDRLAGSRAGLTVSQSLLNGLGTGPNLASLRQARLDTRISEYEFRGFVQDFVASVEKAAWDYLLANRQIEIYRSSLGLAEDSQREAEERVKVGKLAEIEIAAARAEVALRREALINAESALQSARISLLRLLNLPEPNTWCPTVAVVGEADLARPTLDEVQDHVRVALRLRPDLNQARLGIQRNELELVRTRNGLLPKLDFFLTLGRTGYAESFADSYRAKIDDGYDVSAGLTAEYPIANRDARARHQRAVLSQAQAAVALENQRRLAETDVRLAYVESGRALAQVAATQATRQSQEDKLRAETEKFRLGKSTSLLVAQAQRDLLQSQVDEVQALNGCFKTAVDLYRLDGSLLIRRGIDAPGREPVEEPAGN